MKKQNTIKKKDEFTSIIKGKQHVNDLTIAFYYQTKKEEQSRVGITVTNKLGNAVARNKAKRQLREMIQAVFNGQEGFDTILIIRENFKDYSFWDNKKCLERCYKKVRIEHEGQGQS